MRALLGGIDPDAGRSTLAAYRLVEDAAPIRVPA